MRNAVYLLVAGLFSCAAQAAPLKKSPTQTLREAKWEQVSRANLKKTNPLAYYDKYVKGKYYIYDGKPTEVRHVKAKLFQILDDTSALFSTQWRKVTNYTTTSGNPAARQDMVWEVTMMVQGLQTRQMALAQVYDLTLQNVGTYEYTTLRGERQNVAKLKTQPETIDFPTYKRLADAGVAFPCDDPVAEMKKESE